MPKLKLNVPLPIRGVNVDTPGEFIDTRGSASNQNVFVEENVLRTRFGTTEVKANTGQPLMYFLNLSAGTDILLAMDADDVYSRSGAGVWAVEGPAGFTGSFFTDPFDGATPVLSGNKIATYTNGVDAIRKYSGGVDSALGGSPPKCKYMESFGTYLVLAHITDDGSANVREFRVQWSDTGDPETWSTGDAGSVDLIDDNDGHITGIGVIGNFIIIYKASTIYVGQLTNTSAIFRFEKIDAGIGALSNNTIQSLPTGGQIFLSRNGITVFDGVASVVLPIPIQEEIRDSLTTTTNINAFSVINEKTGEYWLNLGLTNKTYKYNYLTGESFIDNRTNVSAFGFLSKSAGGHTGPRTMFLGNTTGEIFEQDETVHDDDGVAVTSQVETKDFTAQDLGAQTFGQLVRWTSLQMWAKGVSVLMEYSVDSGTTWVSITDLSLSTDYPSDGSPDFGWFDVVSSKVRFRFSKDGLAEWFAIKKFFIEGSIREERR